MEKKRVIIALGYFDCVHIGHVKVINKAIETAKKLGVYTAVFTFDGNLKKAIGKNTDKYIFTPLERKDILLSLGADEVLLYPVEKEFIGKTKTEFLDYLNSVYDIKGYVSGDDYTFGKDKGSVSDLIEYAKSRNQTVETVETVLDGGKKIATTEIKSYLLNGRIEKANSLLFAPYFLTGKVFSDRKVASKFALPTANIKVDTEKQPLKEGVYAGIMEYKDKKYKAVINYGSRPTYNLDEKLVEVHAVDFNGNLYGESIKVTFISYIREIKKFTDENELFYRIKKDANIAKEIINL